MQRISSAELLKDDSASPGPSIQGVTVSAVRQVSRRRK